MEMHQIRYFLAVCDAGNFTRASEAAFVSQPSLTQAIQKLESELGGPLFRRDRSGCNLTELGRLLEPELRRIHDQSLSVKSQAVRFVRLKKLPLRIGLMPTVGSRRLAPALARFQKESPRVEVELVVEPEEKILKLLGKGALDLAIGPPSGDPGPAFRREVLYRERYVVAFPAKHRFSKQATIALADLGSESWLDRLNCEMREDLKSELKDRGISLYASYRSNDVEWILRMVQGGIGVAIVPEFTMPEGAAGLDARRLEEPSLERAVEALTAAASAPKAEVRALLKMLRGIQA
jgi:DNA-binding transcriptional LysR family regulator